MAGSKAWRGSCHLSVSTPVNSNVSDPSLISLMSRSTKRARTTTPPASFGGASRASSLDPARGGAVLEPAMGSATVIDAQHTNGTTSAMPVVTSLLIQMQNHGKLLLARTAAVKRVKKLTAL